MKPNFSMDSNFNLFDEWGNYAGKVTPTSGTDGCIAGIAMLIVALIGFVVYIFVKLTILGIKQAIQKNWEKAFLYLLPLILVVGYFAVNALSFQIKTAELKAARADLTKNVVVQNVKRINCGPNESRFQGWISYQVVNLSDKPVYLMAWSSYVSNPCYHGDLTGFPNRGEYLSAKSSIYLFGYYFDRDTCTVAVQSQQTSVCLIPKP